MMTRKKVKNKVLIDIFPPYGETEIIIEGAIAQAVAIIIVIAVVIRILYPLI